MNDAELVKASWDAHNQAYAPYSKFAVGAALLTDDGQVFKGCNVENVSFGLTMCAERVAVGSAISHGCERFQILALTSTSVEAVVPCGACRQVLAEFAPDLRIISFTWNGRSEEFRLNELLPLARQGILE